MNTTRRRVAIVGGNRIPFARSNSAYANASNHDMLTAALDGLIKKHELEDQELGEVVGGAVLKHPRDRDLTREAVLSTRLAPETPAYDLQQACGTGLEAVISVANKIALGQSDSAIACGVDTTSDAPIEVNDDLRRLLLEFNRTRSNADRLKLLAKLRPGHIVPETPQNAEPRTGMSMGEHCSIMAAEWDIGRADQDELTVRSHRNLAAAYESGFMDDLVSAYLGLERDQNLRADSSVEKLGKLNPVFGGPEGTMTAGNSTPLSDGASAVLLASEEWAKERGLPILAYFADGQTAAIDHVHKREGLLMAPAYAVPRMLDRNEIGLEDFELYEIHEAFAPQGPQHSQGMGGSGVQPSAPRARYTARLGRSRSTERQRGLARCRSSLCRHRRPDRRLARQGAEQSRAPGAAWSRSAPLPAKVSWRSSRARKRAASRPDAVPSRSRRRARERSHE